MSGASSGYPWRVLVWLAVRGAATDRRRSVLAVLVGSLGVLVLLSGAAVLPAAGSQRDTAASLQPVIATADANDAGTAGLLIESSREYYRGSAVSAYEVASWRDTSLTPPGVGRVPGPGEVVVSPALAGALRGDPSLRDRFPGRVIGLIGREGLTGPRSLVAWVGAPADQLVARQTGVAVGFQQPGSSDLTVPSAVRVGAPFMVIVFLVPLVALFVVVSLAGSARRSGRLAALRLCGLTSGAARLVAATESAALGALSAALGIVAFLLLAPRLAPLAPIGAGAWPDEVHLVPWAAAGALLGVPALAALVVWRATGRAAADPLQASRAVPAEPPLPRRALWVLVVGLLGLGVADLARAFVGVDVAVLVLVAALLVSLVGVLLNARVLSQSGARALGRRSRHVPVVVAGGQVDRHPRASSVVATGMALLVFFGGILLAFFPLLSDVDAQQAEDLAILLGPTALVATRSVDAGPAGPSGEVTVDGTSRVLVMQSSDEPRSAWISCPELARAAGTAGCTSPQADRIVTQLRVNQLLPFDLEPSRTSSPPPAAAPQLTVVAQPADGVDVELVRTHLLAAGFSDVLTTDERRAERQLDTETFRRATLVALGCAGLVALASLLTGLTDHVTRQRHSLQMLFVLGTSRRQLGRALLLQTALSVAPIVIVAWAVGMVAATVFLRLNDTREIAPSVPASLAVLAGALLAPALAAAFAAHHLRALLDDRTTP